MENHSGFHGFAGPSGCIGGRILVVVVHVAAEVRHDRLGPLLTEKHRPGALDDDSTSVTFQWERRSKALLFPDLHLQWVDLRENLQETIDFLMKYGIFL